MDEPSHPCCVSQAQLRQALEKAGWRFTRQRAAVYEHLASARNHPTAEDLYLAVQRRMPHISLATVYKALEALIDARLAAKLVGEAGPARYDCRRDDHYHMRCTRSGEVHDMPVAYDPQLLDKLDPQLIETLRSQGFHITSYRLEVQGFFEER